uniref:Hypotheticial protein n=1 Tax=Schistosoma japonicum TaxID=6182 RepID=C1L8B0_SCHJA|nr:hypotheticial protein [Schistosoma japonicum]
MTVHLTQYLSFPWEFVSSLFWKRYPNPHARHVLSVDVLERYLLPNGKLYTKRLVIKKISRRIPSWLLKYFPGGQVPVVEESIIDVNTKRIDVVSTNFGHYKKYLCYTYILIGLSLFKTCLFSYLYSSQIVGSYR